MNERQIDELIDKAIRQEQELPEGLSDRLETYLDRLAAEESGLETNRSKGRKHILRSLYWIGGIAASLLLCFGLYFYTEIDSPKHLADTYTDPQEAAMAAHKALALVSSNLNKGIEQMDEANKEIAKVNQIVNKQLKDE